MMLLKELASQHILVPYFTEDCPKYEHSLFALICLGKGFKGLESNDNTSITRKKKEYTNNT